MKMYGMTLRIPVILVVLFLAKDGWYWNPRNLFALPTAEEEDEEDESPPPGARQNDILRAYFRNQYVSLRTERYDLNESFMERYIDRQIDAFLEDVDSRLKGLNSSLDQAEKVYRKLAECADPDVERELAEDLEEVDDAAGGLRGRLANIFLQLDGKEKLPIEINASDGFGEEMTFLKNQIHEAEKRIRDYLFQTTNTIPYQNLKGENMIIRLHWAEKTAEGIRDELRR